MPDAWFSVERGQHTQVYTHSTEASIRLFRFEIVSGFFASCDDTFRGWIGTCVSEHKTVEQRVWVKTYIKPVWGPAELRNFKAVMN